MDLTGSEGELGKKHSTSTNNRRGELRALATCHALPGILWCHTLHIAIVINILQGPVYLGNGIRNTYLGTDGAN